MNLLHNSFHAAGNEQEHQAIDEMMIPFKGRHSGKQYLKSKPNKWGFKMWVRASSDGFVHCYDAYQSKKTKEEFGPIGSSVLQLCHGLEEKGHKLFIDNLFTTLPLLKCLSDNGIYVLGTLRLNRAKEAGEQLVPEKLLQRGWNSVTTSDDNITVLRWKDNKAVHTISTYAGSQPEDIAKRWDRKNKKEVLVERPFAIQQYNMFMGGVDLMDRMISYYPHGFKNKKWYLRMFFHLLNMAIVNSWILYRQKVDKEFPLLNFKAAVATSLLNLGTVEKVKRGRQGPSFSPPPLKKRALAPRAPLEFRYDGEDHYPEKINVPNAPRCHYRNCKSRTRFKCWKCKEPVCPGCMRGFHSK